MNKEQIFSTVKEHLLTQNRRSLSGNRCMYRGHDNTKCAVGCLITDEQYKPEMEGIRVFGLITDHEALKPLAEHLHLLTALQDVHDNIAVQDWPEALTLVAKRFYL